MGVQRYFSWGSVLLENEIGVARGDMGKSLTNFIYCTSSLAGIKKQTNKQTNKQKTRNCLATEGNNRIDRFNSNHHTTALMAISRMVRTFTKSAKSNLRNYHYNLLTVIYYRSYDLHSQSRSYGSYYMYLYIA